MVQSSKKGIGLRNEFLKSSISEVKKGITAAKSGVPLTYKYMKGVHQEKNFCPVNK